MDLKRIKEEIQELQTHPHISDLNYSKQSVINFLYAPSQTNSVYKDKNYALQIFLPQDYPDYPPCLKFQDHIYHLNIHPDTGEVRMAILEEDWSPFLSLTSIIQSLDKILEQPEIQCPCSSQMLYEYETKRDTYLKNVLGSFDQDLHEAKTVKSGIQNQEYDQIISRQKEARDEMSKLKFDKKRSQILVEDFRLNMNGGMSNNFTSPIKDLKDSFLFKEKEKKKDSATKKEDKVKLVKRHELKEEKSKDENSTLQKINEMINLLVKEIQEIEEQMQLSKNLQIKKILQKRQQSQFEMLKQLLQTSENLKRQIVKKLINEASIV